MTDLNGFSHIILLYYFNKSTDYKLLTKPFLDNNIRGVFATRAPQRPNQIGFSVVKLLNISENVLEIENIDVIDQTSLIDIKPYIAEFDVFNMEKEGWYQNAKNKVQNYLRSIPQY